MNCKNCGYGLKQSCGDFEKILCTYEEGECVKITELEKENAELKKTYRKQRNKRIDELQKENAELKEQNTNLQKMLKTERSVTCKEEYLKKVTELEQENAELIHENARLVTVIDKSKSWGISPLNALIINNLDTQFIKAKEIICEYVRLANLEKEDTVAIWQLYHKAEQFLQGVKE